MTDKTDSTPPFPGFPGFPPAEMLERMWGMMRLSPFGSAFSGAQPGAGLTPSLSMMSDMMAPLTNVEELDKRITDMRAVEQWLKLNLSMLQSAIQALEVQRATLATLRAFGAFAQSSMAQPAAAAAPSPAPATGWPHPEAPASESSESSESSTSDEDDATATPPFDASAWWNLLQSQFNQIAQFAMTQPSVATAAAGGGTAREMQAAAEGAASAGVPAGEETPSAATSKESESEASTRRPAAKRTSTSASAKRAAAPRTTKKSI
ncbi:PhaM family polyhydroxyalkanoate granule multifunctional regulatory protein [Paraburkholderia sp. BCC1884]|uniref:PhaM family polyhydroxyalkanoate granule multifunctional regulatory protein n=1 Tax=Paraburkholderia sp. BCC1884 TaxID=2562668 RepID=UPI0011824D8D|nr:PhaM family polyhydroxyalkanoate granule multifunctional regulatory protein [Paraburkholderia sp. BCC1884]